MAFNCHVSSDFFNLILISHVLNSIKEYSPFILWDDPQRVSVWHSIMTSLSPRILGITSRCTRWQCPTTDDVEIVTWYLPGFCIVNPFLDGWLDQKEQRDFVREFDAIE